MINTKFESYKVMREIRRSGIVCKFKRHKKNEFGEPVGDSDICVIKCLYHEQSSNIKITTGETTQIRNKKIPMLLCLYKDMKELKPGDFFVLNGKTYSITGITNVQEWNLIADISLEVFDDGF